MTVDLTAAPVRKVVQINGRRTSLALEPALWDAVDDIAAREGLGRNALLSELDSRARGPNGEPPVNFASVVRVHICTYYRAAAEPKDGTR